jgi:hypothetical protein
LSNIQHSTFNIEHSMSAGPAALGFEAGRCMLEAERFMGSVRGGGVSHPFNVAC